MSDGSISQDEIDALLSGMDMSPAAAPEAAATKTDATDFKSKAFKTFLVNPSKAFEKNLASMTGSESYSDNLFKYQPRSIYANCSGACCCLDLRFCFWIKWRSFVYYVSRDGFEDCRARKS